jgi:hypothetical protein
VPIGSWFFNQRSFGGVFPADAVVSVEPARGSVAGYFLKHLWQVPEQKLYHVLVHSTAISCGAETSMEKRLLEMALQRNAHFGIEDINPRNQYHAQDFRDVARLLGLECNLVDKVHGYYQTTLDPQAMDADATMRPVATVFEVEFH